MRVKTVSNAALGSFVALPVELFVPPRGPLPLPGDIDGGLDGSAEVGDGVFFVGSGTGVPREPLDESSDGVFVGVGVGARVVGFGVSISFEPEPDLLGDEFAGHSPKTASISRCSVVVFPVAASVSEQSPKRFARVIVASVEQLEHTVFVRAVVSGGVSENPTALWHAVSRVCASVYTALFAASVQSLARATGASCSSSASSSAEAIAFISRRRRPELLGS